MMEKDEKEIMRFRAIKRKVRSPLTQEELDDPEMRRPSIVSYTPPGRRVQDGASCSHQPIYYNLPDDEGSVDKGPKSDPEPRVIQCPSCDQWITTDMIPCPYCAFSGVVNAGSRNPQ